MSVFRILVFTDSHLGYKERDEIRSNDSFAAFEESLIHASRAHVDFALHAGDMFDIQKPSQYTLHRTLRILSHYCLGEREHEFRVIRLFPEAIPGADEPPANVRQGSRSQRIYNFERSAQVKIKLPLFMIHGNHDPPLSQEGGAEVVAAVDVLEAANLVNDIGKIDDLDNVIVRPVILEKGDTRIALYGIGYIGDERMNRLFTLKKITFQPVSDENCFNILLIHQNRYKGQTQGGGVPAKRCVHEEMLPSFFDIVIWGHEHDCEIEPKESLAGHYYISQPGSAVYTSMRRGEATVKKNGILEVFERKFRFHSFPLLTPRAFVLRQVGIASRDDLWQRLTVEAELALKETHVFNSDRKICWDRSIAILNSELELEPSSVVASDNNDNGDPGSELEQQIRSLNDNSLPLIRLRVELPTDYNTDTFSASRFGANFQDLLANPQDMILLSRLSKAKQNPGNDKNPNDDVEMPNNEDGDDDDDPENMIFKYMEDKGALKIFAQQDLNNCVKKYANKIDLTALDSMIRITVQEYIRTLRNLPEYSDDRMLEAIGQMRDAGTSSLQMSITPTPNRDAA
ncbi:putative DNA repair protein [Gregarina niphandrodes]|uniref:Double-strand break repair protein n=1 Tax=Gregarina niphandrodes TaxID=110365 RepID=A0A023AYT9_GRENI|nr:putative DNA repair protein [Gregarina niphandrodes]EZG43837.1 putative DNA repair protein [Gregarina niphandrodes]|eukprot:XP_011132992.1 putative DNA repair protein [Gregarina niphandrodes]